MIEEHYARRKYRMEQHLKSDSRYFSVATLLFFGVIFLAQFSSDPAPSQGIQSIENSSVQDILISQRNEMLPQLPIELSDEMTWVSVSVEENTLVYYYEISTPEPLNPETFYELQRPNLIESYCTNEDLRFYRENNVELKYNYIDLTNIAVTNADCVLR